MPWRTFARVLTDAVVARGYSFALAVTMGVWDRMFSTNPAVGAIPPYLLGKQLNTRISNIQLDADAVTEIVQADANRVMLMIFSSNSRSTHVWVTTGGASDHGILLSDVWPPFQLNVMHHGVLPQFGWSAFANGGIDDICVIELIWNPPS